MCLMETVTKYCYQISGPPQKLLAGKTHKSILPGKRFLRLGVTKDQDLSQILARIDFSSGEITGKSLSV